MLTRFYFTARRVDRPSERPELVIADLDKTLVAGDIVPRMTSVGREQWKVVYVFENGEKQMLLSWIKREGWEKVKKTFTREGLEAFLAKT